MKLNTFDERLMLTNGVYHSLVNARKPVGIDDKKAYLIGSGLASLSAAAFLIHDAHMKGENITILEMLDIAGGSLDGHDYPELGYVARGGREMGHHFEVLWNLFSFIPSIENPDMSVLDEFFYINYDDHNFSKTRITHKNGLRYDNNKFNLTQKQALELIQFTIMDDESLVNKRIDEVFSKGLLKSDFWTYWRTMFAFENWHSALEMKLYLNRFIHHVDGLTDLSALQFTKHDQYTSFVLPLVKYLKDNGVVFKYDFNVDNVEFTVNPNKKTATKIVAHDKNNKDISIDLTENDLVFITNGSMTENSGYGDNDTKAPLITENVGGCWKLWKNIASQSDDFGKPEKFCSDIEKTNWESATITYNSQEITEYVEKITKRSPYTGKTVTGGIVTAIDSGWLMSWTINRQPQYIGQPKDDVEVWTYGLFSNTKGDYIKKPMRDCTGSEIAKEWLFHIGVPVKDIERLVKYTKTIPVMMPYITSQFMPRDFGDRPYVVPKNAVNFAFIGQFAETLDDPGRDTVFTTEYSGRTAMEAVYVLCGVEKGVPEVYASRYDMRYLLNAIHYLLDEKEPKLFVPGFIKRGLNKKLSNTDIEKLLKEYDLI